MCGSIRSMSGQRARAIHEVSFALRDGDTLLGACFGTNAWNWLHIDVLWMRDDLHSQGCRSRLLSATEAEANG